MGWRDCYLDIKLHIESKEFNERNKKWNPNDPKSALAIALKKLYNEVNPWGHKL